MKITNDAVVREVAGDILLIPTGKAAMNANGLISLSPSGELLIKKLQAECTFDDLISCLMDEYEVGQTQAEADTEKFLNKLKDLGLLCEE